MSTKAMEDLRDKICDELDDLAEKVSREGKISMADLQKVSELVDIKKNMLKVEKLEDEAEYSQAGDWEAMGRGRFGDRYARDGGYDENGNSYRGRKRDSMGRYSRARDGRDGRMGAGGRGGYSRDGGDELMEHVDMMMESAETPREREMIKRFKKQLEEL